MKKLGRFALAFALVLGLTQCKKENTATSNDEGFKVPITLNVGGASCGSKVAVDGSTGVVTFESGDVIHVVSDGTYVGMLTYDGINFSGEVTDPTEGQKLHFYFLGNETPVFNADNTGCSVVISDQTGYLPVISYAPSRENYQVGLTAYNATLLNKCALVKFDVTTASEAATCILGMNNKVTVDFTDNGFTYSQEGEGVITLAAGNGEKWAILLPQEEVTYTYAYSTDGIYNGSCATIPSIEENDYLTNGIAVAISHPMGAIHGLFTINANGDQVYFSQGNLQYIGSAATPYWKFADNQWDYLGTTTGQNSSDQNVDRDLFGWGTSGYNHGASCYQPWSTSTNESQYYAYGKYTYNLYDQTGKADWGYNAIANGGNQENFGWRTLSNAEWGYVFNSRANASLKWGEGMVNGVNGVILLPDEWTLPEGLSFTSGNSMWANVYPVNLWAQMEANGAVFLPAAGSRNGTSVYNVGWHGYYWSSSYGNNNIYYNYAYSVIFYSDYLFVDAHSHHYLGHSVRLVRHAE